MVDVKKLAKKLVDAGWDQKRADAKVTQLIKKAKEISPGEKDDIIQGAVSMAIDQIVAMESSQKFVGVCLAVSDKTDRNDFQKRNALRAYEQNPVIAVQEKMVVVVNGKVVPLDNRKYLDAAQKIENRNYGKPLKEVLQREGVFLVGNDIVRVFGDYDADIGMIYDIFGKKSPGGSISVRRPGVRLAGEAPESTFRQAYEALSKSPMAVGLDGVKDAKGAIATTGFVRFEKETTREMPDGFQQVGHMIVIDDDSAPDGIVCFSGSESARDAMSKLAVGTEVIVFGRPMSTTDRQTGEQRFALSLTGVIANPESAKCAAIVDKLDSLLYEE